MTEAEVAHWSFNSDIAAAAPLQEALQKNPREARLSPPNGQIADAHNGPRHIEDAS